MYDFEAGNISLDFANTMDYHASEQPVEFLNSYLELITWSEKAGLISSEAATRLHRLADDEPDESARFYQFSLQFREALYRIFVQHANGMPIPTADLSLLNEVARQAMSHMELVLKDNTFQWQFPSDLQGGDLILWPIARAATELLISDQAPRIRQCEDDRGCGYLFIDTTKNHSRRWCSMESCGNRAKARRHYSRQQSN